MTAKQVQCLLSYLGYEPGAVDGIWGSATRGGLEAFQKAQGLEPDGIPGALTQAALVQAVADGSFCSAPEKLDGENSAGDFWGQIPNFTREEFRCRCGGKYCGGFPAEPTEKLVQVAQRCREHFGVPVTVSSGLRCPSHNAAVGGVANSLHLTGRAMDFSVRGKSARQVLDWLASQPEIAYSYAITQDYVHMDIGREAWT